MNILGYRITIVKIDRPDVGNLPIVFWKRRKLAHLVIEYCKEHHASHDPYNGKIGKIKAVRNMKRCGLVKAKNWVEIAFANNGWDEDIL